jgi:hypothetical protein
MEIWLNEWYTNGISYLATVNLLYLESLVRLLG